MVNPHLATNILHVCSGLLILHVSSTPRQEFPIEMYGREPTFESLAKPTPKRYARRDMLGVDARLKTYF